MTEATQEQQGTIELNKEGLLWIYEKMRLIREFETTASALVAQGVLPGFVHLYAGEEAIGVGVMANLTDRESGRRFKLREGVRFLEEVSGADDIGRLVGKVKDLNRSPRWAASTWPTR